MILKVSIAIFLYLSATSAQEKSEQVILQFKDGVQYQYEYFLSLSTMEENIADKPSEVNYTVNFLIESFGNEGILKIYNVTAVDNSQDVELDPVKNHFTDYYLRFNMSSDGVIEWILADKREENWVLNFKRALLSLFHTDKNRAGFNEDVHGVCATLYEVSKSDNKIKINRQKENCKLRSVFEYFRTTAYEKNELAEQHFKETVLEQICNNEIIDKVYAEINCEEKFTTVSQTSPNVINVILQKVRLLSTFTKTLIVDLNTYINNVAFQPNKRDSNLIYEAQDFMRPLNDKALFEKSKLQVDDICKNHEKSFINDELVLIFFEAMKVLNFQELTQFEEYSNLCKNSRRLFINLLPHLPNKTKARNLMFQLIGDEKVSKYTEEEWLTILSFLKKVDKSTLDYAHKMVIKNPTKSPNRILTVGSLVRAYCDVWYDCSTETKPIVDFLIKGIIDEQLSKKNHVLLYSYLAACYNTRMSFDEIGVTLGDILYDRTLPDYVRRAVVDLVSVRMSSVVRYTLGAHLSERNETAEFCTLAFQRLINKYPKNLLEVIEARNLTIKETTPGERYQLTRFIWSYLCDGEYIKENVQNIEPLNNPFYQDFCKDYAVNSTSEKFSHFYKVDDVESSVVFSPKSFVPRNIRTNKTSTSFDLIMYNIDKYIKSIFIAGQKRTKRSPLNEKQQEDDPFVALNFEYLGKTIKHFSVKGDDEILKLLKVDMSKIKDTFADENGVVFEKSGFLGNKETFRITAAGFPLFKQWTFDYSARLQLKGNLDIEKFYKSQQLHFDGEIIPSISGGLFTRNTIDAYYTKSTSKTSLEFLIQRPVSTKIDVSALDDVHITLDSPIKNVIYKFKPRHTVGMTRSKCDSKPENIPKIENPVELIDKLSNGLEWDEAKEVIDKYGYCDFDVKKYNKTNNDQLQFKWIKADKNSYNITVIRNNNKTKKANVLVNNSEKSISIKLMQEENVVMSLNSDYEDENDNKYMTLKFYALGDHLRIPELFHGIQSLYVPKGLQYSMSSILPKKV